MNEDIRELLTRGASDAADTDLVTGVWQQAHRHRRNRNLGIGSLAAAGVALVIGITQIGGGTKEPVLPADDTGATATATASEDSAPVLPDGWRWESFGGVQVGVPGDWDWGVTPSRLSDWCHLEDPEAPQSAVTRPGSYATMECPGGVINPGPITNTKDLVVFDWSTSPDREPDVRSERTTLQLNGVSVIVQGPEALREQIVGTVSVVDTDAHGCPSTHTITTDPAWRPSGPTISALTDVSSVSVCRYALRPVPPANPNTSTASLISSLRLEGADAQNALAPLEEAPPGSGPNSPEACAEPYGDQAIILRVTSAAGTSDVVVRYSGCDHHGFDSGHDVRALTEEALSPFNTAPNLIAEAAGDAVLEILLPDPTQR